MVAPTYDQQLQKGASLRKAGELAESLSVLRDLADQVVSAQGRRTYESQCALSQLGRTLRAVGRGEELAEAERLHWEVLATRLDAYGADDYYTCNSAAILADTLALAGGPGSEQCLRYLRDWRPGAGGGEMPPALREQLHRARDRRDAFTARGIDDAIDAYLRLPPARRLAPGPPPTAGETSTAFD